MIEPKEKKLGFIGKHKQLILYFVFGIVTTVCSLLACYLTLKLGVLIPALRDESGEPTELLDILGSTTQWISGVIVAFLTNKKWVFTDAPKGREAGLKQFYIFSASRVGTYFLEAIMNLLTIRIFELCAYRTIVLALGFMSINLTSRIWSKAITSVAVVVINYFISKLLVFKKAK